MYSIQHSKFAVDESPFVVWEWDLRERNIAFINNIDPEYFRYLADIHLQGLESDEQKQRAALSLRAAYSHGLETLFALLFATIQAPDCVIGWLHKYDLGDLRNLVWKVERCQPILSKLRIATVSWKGISDTILSLLSIDNKEEDLRIKQHFATAWARFAGDFTDEKSSQEYNSIKHGFRVKAGGFKLAIGSEDTPGIPASPEKMHSLGGYEFGSSFYIPERIGEDKLNFRVRRHRRNWRPENFIYGLYLISIFLQNILSLLKVVNGVDAATVQFSWPSDESLFEEPWRPIGGVTGMSMNTIILPEHITPFNKEEILGIYEADDNDKDTNQEQSTKG